MDNFRRMDEWALANVIRFLVMHAPRSTDELVRITMQPRLHIEACAALAADLGDEDVWVTRTVGVDNSKDQIIWE